MELLKELVDRFRLAPDTYKTAHVDAVGACEFSQDEIDAAPQVEPVDLEEDD